LRVLWLLVTAIIVNTPALAENLKVRIDGDRLRVSGDAIHFLTGRPLDRLHNGAVVTYVLQLTVRAERAGRVLSRLAERFTFSYDLWEEKFAVTKQGVPSRSASNLSPSGAESWCLDNLSIPAAQVPADRNVWLSVDYESEEPKDAAPNSDSPLTLGTLIDIFSRRPRNDQQVHGSVEIGPVSLDELRKKK